MNDIVERLEKQAEDNLDPGNALVREAAAEIKRLRAENAVLRAILANTPDPHEVEHMRHALESKP